MQDLHTNDPDGKHPLVNDPIKVEIVPTEEGIKASEEAAKLAPSIDDSTSGTDPAYIADLVLSNNLAVPTDYTVPRHGPGAGDAAERVVPYTATGANPSYPQDREPGFEEAAPEVEETEDIAALGTEEAAAEAESEVESEDGRPPQSATKAEWVDWVTANFEISAEDAEALTKADLIETYGTEEG